MSPAPQASVAPVIPDYELLRPIGKGSYGEVWLARSVTGVFRVIKVVRRDRFDDERPYLRELEGISRFQAAASGRPRQLALLHVGRNDGAGYFYYVMEPADDAEAGSSIDPDRYVPLTLKELFSRRGRLPANECIQLALELARGLAILHGANLIHRDIKPSNIIFVQRVPKLADVGLVASSEATMTCAGTPGYAPREGAGTVAADVFSLGKVLYEIATGLDRMEFPRLPSDIVDGPDAPLLREINSIVLKACHHDPAARHASAEALARDLEVVQAGRSVAFYEALRKRLRAVAFAAALVALLAGGGAGLLVWRSQILAAANEQTRQALYRSDLAVAQLARSSGDLGRARAALLRQIPKPGESDLRGLEWRILSHAVRGEGTPLEPASEGNAVVQIVTDPSGRWAAASFKDDRAAIWDLTTRRITRRLNNVRVLGGFTRDGTLIIDETNRALRYESPTQGTLRRWETGQRLGTSLKDGGIAVISPSGDFCLRFFSRSSTDAPIELNISKAYPGYETSTIGTSPKGDSAYLGLYKYNGARRERLIVCLNPESGEERWQRPIPVPVNWIEISQDGKQMAANYGGSSAILTDTLTGQIKYSLAGHAARVHAGAFSYDGKYFATASADQTIRTWLTESGSSNSVHHGLGRPAMAIAWMPSSLGLIAGDDQGNLLSFQFPAVETENSVEGLFADVHGDFVFSQDGSTIAASATTNTIRIIRSKDLSTITTLTNTFQPISFHNSNKYLIAFKSDWTLNHIDISSGLATEITNPVPNSVSITGFTVSHNRDRIAFAGNAGEIIHIDLTTKATWIRQDASSNALWGLAYSRDGSQLWTGSSLGLISQWSTQTGTKEIEINSLPRDLGAMALSRDSRWLAVAPFDDSSIRIMDLSVRRWIHPLQSHRRFVQTIIFTDDSRRLVSGGADGKVVIWRIPEFEEITSFDLDPTPNRNGDEGIAILQYEPNAAALGSLTDDGRLNLWRTE